MNLALVGAGNAAVTIMNHLRFFENHTIAGIADLSPDAPGMLRARELGIETTTSMDTVVTRPDVDLVIELTGVAKVREMLAGMLRDNQTLITSDGARLMIDLIESQIRQNQLMAEEITVKFDTLTGKMDTIIKDIGASTQTIETLLREGKMVSMNATIEAARAGDAGNSFGIVVDRIADLVGRIQDTLVTISKASDGTQATLSEFSRLEEELLTAFSSADETVPENA